VPTPKAPGLSTGHYPQVEVMTVKSFSFVESIVHKVWTIPDCALLQNMNLFSDSIFQLIGHLPVNWTVIAQQITDPNVLGQMQNIFNHFVQTGQVWALLIGLCIGYMIRNLTSYG